MKHFIFGRVQKIKKFDLIFEDEIVLRGSRIIGKTANKVLKFDSNSKLYTTMSNESVLNTIKQYLQNLWKLKIQTFFDFLEIMSDFGNAIYSNCN